jgi:hypothetical protein
MKLKIKSRKERKRVRISEEERKKFREMIKEIIRGDKRPIQKTKTLE